MLVVKEIPTYKMETSLFAHLKGLEFHALNYEPWSVEKSGTKTFFKIAHDTQNVYLQFKIEEENTLATYINDYDHVYEDSCVEFFINTNSGQYINFEFNAIGTCLAQKGKGRESRESLPLSFIRSIVREASLKNEKMPIVKKNIEWDLSLLIPLGQLLKRKLSNLATKGNFYKCGDRLPTPHYLAWSRIETPAPDFHCPIFFENIYFE